MLILWSCFRVSLNASVHSQRIVWRRRTSLRMAYSQAAKAVTISLSNLSASSPHVTELIGLCHLSSSQQSRCSREISHRFSHAGGRCESLQRRIWVRLTQLRSNASQPSRLPTVSECRFVFLANLARLACTQRHTYIIAIAVLGVPTLGRRIFRGLHSPKDWSGPFDYLRLPRLDFGPRSKRPLISGGVIQNSQSLD